MNDNEQKPRATYSDDIPLCTVNGFIKNRDEINNDSNKGMVLTPYGWKKLSDVPADVPILTPLGFVMP